MKRNVFLLVLFLLIFLSAPFVLGFTQAATLKFDKTAVTVTVGGTVDVAIIVDAGSDQISSTDAYVTYDATLLEPQTVAAGTFFPTVTNNITSGKVYVVGLVDDPAVSKTGTGTLATITFKGLANGTGTLTFDCQATGTNTSKIVKNDLNATNIISCTDNGTAAVSVGSGAGSSSTISANLATPSALPRTGIFDNVRNLVIPGTILLMMGGLLRFVL